MGYHLYHFYENEDSLARVLAHFFMEGLRKLEYCVWITKEGLTHNRAVELLSKCIPEIEDYILKGHMHIEPFDAWALTKERKFDGKALMNKWMSKYNEVMAKGYMTMRAVGDPGPILHAHWDNFMAFEEELNAVVDGLNCVLVCA